MTDHQILAVTSVALPALFACLLMITPRRWMTAVSLASGTATGAIAAAVAAGSIIGYRDPEANGWIVLDAAGGLLVAVVGAVGLIGVWVSPAYLRSVDNPAQQTADGPAPQTADSPAPRHRGPRVYYSVFFAFWAILLAVPLVGNLGGAWILIEATTAASALLVGFTGKPRALEAGWKYLVLTSLGLGVALLGIALIAAGIPGGGLGALSWRALATYDAGQQAGTVAYLLLIAGLAAKIGWAPVHNWLPDAHSEAPAPVSAILSAALLPTVLLIAWRCQQGLAPAIGLGTTQGVFILFGLASIAVAVPFLGQALAFKRILAYSSLEHMGIIALGIGFASPLALAGVTIHLAGHAVAKALGFSAMIPLLSHEPRASRRAVTGVGRTQPALGAVLTLSLGALAGLPPSPLFVSELLIVAGGFQSGHPWAAGAATVLVALAFLGLLRTLLTTTAGEAEPGSTASASATASATAPASAPASAPATAPRPVGLRSTMVLASICAVVLIALAGGSAWLPTTDFANALMKGIQ